MIHGVTYHPFLAVGPTPLTLATPARFHSFLCPMHRYSICLKLTSIWTVKYGFSGIEIESGLILKIDIVGFDAFL